MRPPCFLSLLTQFSLYVLPKKVKQKENKDWTRPCSHCIEFDICASALCCRFVHLRHHWYHIISLTCTLSFHYLNTHTHTHPPPTNRYASYDDHGADFRSERQLRREQKRATAALERSARQYRERVDAVLRGKHLITVDQAVELAGMSRYFSAAHVFNCLLSACTPIYVDQL